MGLPVNTPNGKLLEHGVHNTYAELNAAVLISQRNRPRKTRSGREILTRPGITPYPRHLDEGLISVPETIRRMISVAPLPKNMTREENTRRREERVKWLKKQLTAKTNVIYVDAARYNWAKCVATAVDWE